MRSCPFASGVAKGAGRTDSISAVRSAAAPSVGTRDTISPSTPATIGHDDEVPPKLEVVSPGSAPSGPAMSVVSVPTGETSARHSPRFEKLVASSNIVVAPTVTRPGIASSSSLWMRRESLPAANTTLAPRPPWPLAITSVSTAASGPGTGTLALKPQLFETTATSSCISTKS